MTVFYMHDVSKVHVLCWHEEMRYYILTILTYPWSKTFQVCCVGEEISLVNCLVLL